MDSHNGLWGKRRLLLNLLLFQEIGHAWLPVSTPKFAPAFKKESARKSDARIIRKIASHDELDENDNGFNYDNHAGNSSTTPKQLARRTRFVQKTPADVLGSLDFEGTSVEFESETGQPVLKIDKDLVNRMEYLQEIWKNEPAFDKTKGRRRKVQIFGKEEYLESTVDWGSSNPSLDQYRAPHASAEDIHAQIFADETDYLELKRIEKEQAEAALVGEVEAEDELDEIIMSQEDTDRMERLQAEIDNFVDDQFEVTKLSVARCCVCDASLAPDDKENTCRTCRLKSLLKEGESFEEVRQQGESLPQRTNIARQMSFKQRSSKFSTRRERRTAKIANRGGNQGKHNGGGKSIEDLSNGRQTMLGQNSTADLLSQTILPSLPRRYRKTNIIYHQLNDPDTDATFYWNEETGEMCWELDPNIDWQVEETPETGDIIFTHHDPMLPIDIDAGDEDEL